MQVDESLAVDAVAQLEAALRKAVGVVGPRKEALRPAFLPLGSNLQRLLAEAAARRRRSRTAASSSSLSLSLQSLSDSILGRIRHTKHDRSKPAHETTQQHKAK